jgi:hypothetical protein
MRLSTAWGVGAVGRGLARLVDRLVDLGADLVLEPAAMLGRRLLRADRRRQRAGELHDALGAGLAFLEPLERGELEHLGDRDGDLVRPVGAERGDELARHALDLVELAELDRLADRVARPGRLADLRDSAIGEALVELVEDRVLRHGPLAQLLERPHDVRLGLLGQHVDRRQPAAAFAAVLLRW